MFLSIELDDPVCCSETGDAPADDSDTAHDRANRGWLIDD
jgi:hypothetical protein